MARPRSKAVKSKPLPEGAVFPKLKGKWHYVFSDGDKKWEPIPPKGQAPKPKGKFAFALGHSEVFDEGFQSTRQTGFSESLSEPPSRWACVTWIQLAYSVKPVGFWCKDENGQQWSLGLDDPELAQRPIEGRTFQTTLKRKKISTKFWDLMKENDSITTLANPPDWLSSASELFENSICKRPSFPKVSQDSLPHRVVWWIRRNGGLLRLRQPPDSAEPLVATLYHFCPSPGFFVRVEIVVPFSSEEKAALKEQTTPCNFSEYLEQMRLSIAEFKDTPRQISDPESTGTWSHVRINPVYDLYLHAAGALHRLKALLAYEETTETNDHRALRMEWIAREAITLGEKSTLLFISSKIPVLRRREKMDESAGRPAKSTRMQSAVHEFVVQHQDSKASKILSRLRRLAQSGDVQIGWIDDKKVFQHEEEAKPQWSENTMLKEIRKALRLLKKAS